MEKFVLAGKAKTVFQIIELMARGEIQSRTPQDKDLQKIWSWTVLSNYGPDRTNRKRARTYSA